MVILAINLALAAPATNEVIENLAGSELDANSPSDPKNQQEIIFALARIGRLFLLG